MVKKEVKKPARHHVKKPVPAAEKHEKKPAAKTYFFAIGRRKTARAKVKFFPEGSGQITVNGREFGAYFPTFSLQKMATAPLAAMGMEKKVNLVIDAKGGGSSAQAVAMNLGIARAILKADPETRSVLKKQGFLRRDPRKKERKKPGLKRARRAPQWAKR